MSVRLVLAIVESKASLRANQSWRNGTLHVFLTLKATLKMHCKYVDQGSNTILMALSLASYEMFSTRIDYAYNCDWTSAVTRLVIDCNRLPLLYCCWYNYVFWQDAYLLRLLGSEDVYWRRGKLESFSRYPYSSLPQAYQGWFQVFILGSRKSLIVQFCLDLKFVSYLLECKSWTRFLVCVCGWWFGVNRDYF